MNTLYIEPFSGISGDMFLGALCGLADTYEEMKDMDEIAMADHLKNKVIELKEEAKYLLKK